MSLPGKKIPAERAATLCEQYRASLLDDVVPWWMKHSLDRELRRIFQSAGARRPTAGPTTSTCG